MEALTIHFEVEPGFDADALVLRVAEELGRIDGVQAAEADVEDERIGIAEAGLVIAGIVMLTKSARQGVDELRQLVASLRELVKEVDGLRGAALDLGGRKWALDDPELLIAAMQNEP
jgi:hypothetical protein